MMYATCIPTFFIVLFLPTVQHFKASLHCRSAKLSNTWHTVTGKGCHITWCTLCINDTSVLQALQYGPMVSVIQRFHCILLCMVL